ncbi:MAG: phosphatase PAP2 family protein [Chitinophagaceae bacterium]
MNTNVINNYSKLKPSLFFLPIFLLLTIVLFLYHQDSLNALNYIQIQKDSFFFINYNLGQFPNIQYNITQLGDASILFSFLSIFIVYAPKIWESLISASLVSLIFSSVLKNIFSVPRPAVVFDNNTFVIIGKTAVGSASLPSGHSITVFTTLTVLLFAFIPKKLNYKILWSFFIIITGLIIAFTRVGIGAHYPLDVIIGSIIGYISGLTGIFINQKYKIWTWINNKKYYPIFILLMLICCISLIIKIIDENLLIFYLALISLFFPFYKIIYVFVKK